MELIQTVSTAKARGQVEKWLLELERVMKETVLAQIFDTFESYPTEEFSAWISHWPGQFVCIQSLKILTVQFIFSFHSFYFRAIFFNFCFFLLWLTMNFYYRNFSFDCI